MSFADLALDAKAQPFKAACVLKFMTTATGMTIFSDDPPHHLKSVDTAF